MPDSASTMNPKRSTGVVPQKTVGLLQIATMLCLVAIGFMTLMLWAVSIGNSNGKDGNRDFIQYWAAGDLLVQGKNPYDPVAILKLERPAGYKSNPAAISFSPPVLFVLVAPLGLVNAKAASIAWFFFLLGCLVLSLQLIQSALGSPPLKYFLFAFCFAPVLTCFMAGQIGIVLLLAVALFLRFHDSQPMLAGAALLPCAWKPHLFVPFGLVMLLWMVRERRFRLAIGIVLGIAAAVAFSLWIDPQGWTQWSRFMHTVDPANQFQPTLSKALRNGVYREATWIQFLPELVSSVWAIGYYWLRRDRWNWMDGGLLLLIVSMGCAPYAWLTDEAIVIPALIAAVLRAREAGRTLLPLVLILLVSETILIRGHWMDTLDYLWTTPAYLAWWLFATWKKRETETSLAPD